MMRMDQRAAYGIPANDDPWSQVPDPSDPLATARAYFDHFLSDNGGMRKENDGEPRRYANIFFDFRRGRSKYYRDVLGIDNGKVSTFASQDWQLIKETEYGRKFWKRVADETARLYDRQFPGQRQRQPSYTAPREPPSLSITTSGIGIPSVLAPPVSAPALGNGRGSASGNSNATSLPFSSPDSRSMPVSPFHPHAASPAPGLTQSRPHTQPQHGSGLLPFSHPHPHPQSYPAPPPHSLPRAGSVSSCTSVPGSGSLPKRRASHQPTPTRPRCISGSAAVAPGDHTLLTPPPSAPATISAFPGHYAHSPHSHARPPPRYAPYSMPTPRVAGAGQGARPPSSPSPFLADTPSFKTPTLPAVPQPIFSLSASGASASTDGEHAAMHVARSHSLDQIGDGSFLAPPTLSAQRHSVDMGELAHAHAQAQHTHVHSSMLFAPQSSVPHYVYHYPGAPSPSPTAHHYAPCPSASGYTLASSAPAPSPHGSYFTFAADANPFQGHAYPHANSAPASGAVYAMEATAGYVYAPAQTHATVPPAAAASASESIGIDPRLLPNGNAAYLGYDPEVQLVSPTTEPSALPTAPLGPWDNCGGMAFADWSRFEMQPAPAPQA